MPQAMVNFRATKVSKEQRISFEVAVDPFYSETNMAELRRRISDGPEHWHIHELIEADNDYTRVRLGSPTAICGRTEETSITGSR